MKQIQQYFDLIKQKDSYALLAVQIKHGKYTLLSDSDQESVLLCLCSSLRKEEALFPFEDDYLIFLHQHTPLGIMEWIDQLDEQLEQIHFLHAAIGIRFLQEKDIFTQCKKDAYLAMLHSKDHPKYTTTYDFFHKELLASLQLQEKTYQMLQQALMKQQFQIFLQPKLDMKTQQLCGAEALLRLYIEHKEIPLASFLPLANSNAFIRELDLFVLEEVCRFLKQCKEQQLPLLPISINISPSSFMDGKHYTARVKSIIAAYGLDPHWIEFELNEDIALQNSSFLFSFLNDLQQQGHPISLDDFGSGYSSLLLLADLKIDTIKLDQQFFHPPFHKRKQILIAALIKTLHELGYQVLAEGIEQEDRYAFIQQQHCDVLQGFYFHPPLPLEDYLNLVSNVS